jgi:type 1 fimbria pilin
MNSKMICLLAAMMLAMSTSVFAAAGKTYEMTGTIVAATGTTLAVEKGGEKYEFAIDPAMIKGSAELKVGSTVTVTYVMSATKVEGSGTPAAATTPTP